MCLKGVYVEKAEWSLGESLACRVGSGREQRENEDEEEMACRAEEQRRRGGGEGGVGGRGNGLQEVGEAAASIPGLPVCPVTNSCPYPSVPGSFSQREVLACSYKLVHLFNSMLVQFGSGDSQYVQRLHHKLKLLAN